MAQDFYEVLSRVKCFYLNDFYGEVNGPVSLLAVSEMISSGVLSRYTQVILEGSDYWRTYFEQENLVFPSEESKLNAARVKNPRTTFVFYFHQEEVVGPLLLSEVLSMIEREKLNPDTLICLHGREEWFPVADSL